MTPGTTIKRPAYQLYLGDCLEFMRTMDAGSVEAVVTDPPYGINGDYNSYQDSPENLAKIIPEFITQARRIARRCVAIFTGVKNMDLYIGCDWRLSWVCPAGSGVSAWGFTCWNPISVYGKDPFAGNGSRPDVFVDYNPRRIGVGHPYEKPLSIMRWTIERCSLKGWTVFDPFMGSGSTGVACMQLGRNFIGAEIDPGYFKIAERRIYEASLQPPLFTDAQDEPQAEQLEML